jgi:hypothetical protein
MNRFIKLSIPYHAHFVNINFSNFQLDEPLHKNRTVLSNNLSKVIKYLDNLNEFYYHYYERGIRSKDKPLFQSFIKQPIVNNMFLLGRLLSFKQAKLEKASVDVQQTTTQLQLA